MKKSKKNTTESKSTQNPVFEPTVKIVDGKLIISLPNAKIPVVWQMDLNQAQSSAFTIEEDKKDKSFALILKTQDGKIENIASYETKDSAVAILMQTSGVLQNAQGQIKEGANNIAPRPENVQGQNPQNNAQDKNNKRGALLAFLLILTLLIVWFLSASVGGLDDRGVATQTAINDQNPRKAAGVPVSAEDFLNSR